jgi:hypothetical protein
LTCIDPTLPPAIKQMLISAKAKENAQQPLQQEPPEPEYVFPPWPEGLPPPPPLPPAVLPGKISFINSSEF